MWCKQLRIALGKIRKERSDARAPLGALHVHTAIAMPTYVELTQGARIVGFWEFGPNIRPCLGTMLERAEAEGVHVGLVRRVHESGGALYVSELHRDGHNWVRKELPVSAKV